jgi:hypothetical protein
MLIKYIFGKDCSASVLSRRAMTTCTYILGEELYGEKGAQEKLKNFNQAFVRENFGEEWRSVPEVVSIVVHIFDHKSGLKRKDNLCSTPIF